MARSGSDPLIPITRFAPSPTGKLHLGHVFAAMTAWQRAHGMLGAGAAGRYLVRIEDIDIARSRLEWEQALLEDLAWLGLGSEGPVLRQSERLVSYQDAVAKLDALGVLYPCFCTRRDINAELRSLASAPHGPDGPHYPGTCRRLTDAERVQRQTAGQPYSLRLDAERAAAMTGPLVWVEEATGDSSDRNESREVAVRPDVLGDVILSRKDAPASYHVAVVVDDAAQDISVVTRGCDLLPATHIHRLLQALLGLPAPRYLHHRLLADDQGKRLAKRADSLSVAALRGQGLGPEEIKAQALAGPFMEDLLDIDAAMQSLD
jgi:glutamyl-Q tRNA(Asp) synthetase